MSKPLLGGEPPAERPSRDDANRVQARIHLGHLDVRADVAVTPKGLLAVGGVLTAVMLSSVPIILAAKSRGKRRPF